MFIIIRRMDMQYIMNIQHSKWYAPIALMDTYEFGTPSIESVLGSLSGIHIYRNRFLDRY